MDRFATTARVKYPLFTKRWIHRQHPHDQHQTKKHQSLECCALRTLSLKLCRVRTRLAARPAPEDALVGRRPPRGCDGRPVQSILAGSSVCICYLFRQDKYYHYLHPTLLRCTSFWPPFIYWSRAHGHMCGRACCVGWLGDKIISKWQIRIIRPFLLFWYAWECVYTLYTNDDPNGQTVVTLLYLPGINNYTFQPLVLWPLAYLCAEYQNIISIEII